jgi:hypothetical protein
VHRSSIKHLERHPAVSEVRVLAVDRGMTDCHLDGAIDWVAAHPDHSALRKMKMSLPAPIMTVIAGGSQMAQRANSSKPMIVQCQFKLEGGGVPARSGPTRTLHRLSFRT